MSRLPQAPIGSSHRPAPDIYSVLLLVGVLSLLIMCVVVYLNLTQNYGLSFVELFRGAKIPH